MPDKIIKKLEDKAYVEDVINKRLSTKKTLYLELKKLGDPVSDSRPRTGRGGHFYNPKSSKSEEFRKYFKEVMTPENRLFLEEIIKDTSAEYYISMEVDYYLKIQKANSIANKVLKESKIIRPDTRPDIDNYDKFLCDSLHEVLYDDDKRVVSMTSNKYYSLNPRTEIRVYYEIY